MPESSWDPGKSSRSARQVGHRETAPRSRESVEAAKTTVGRYSGKERDTDQPFPGFVAELDIRERERG